MNAMVSRTMGALMLTGLLAGHASAMGEDGQFEDWKLIKTFDSYDSLCDVAPSCPRVYVITPDPGWSGPGTINRSDNGGDDWTSYACGSYIFKEDLAINPSDPNLFLSRYAG